LKQFLIYQEKRIEIYHTEAYFVEPDIKEGLGGLRDLHFMAWMARIYFKSKRVNHIKRFAVFSYFEFDKLTHSASYLLKIRNHLHHLTGRKEDRLLLSYQQDLSHSLGYEDGSHVTAAVKFLTDLYLHLNRVRYGHEEFLSKAMDIIDPLPLDRTPKRLHSEFQVTKGNIVLKEGRISEKDPIVILKAFNEANRLGLFLGSGFIWESKKIIATRGREIAASSDAKTLFIETILHPKNPRLIRLSLEIGLINLFIPEFRNIRNLPELGQYHVETVDLHSISALEILNNITKGSYDNRWPLFHEVFKELKHTDRLYLSVFLHDIGKGYGKDHTTKGAALIPEILQRFDIDGGAMKVVPLLVMHHLLLAHISQHRDLNDEKTSVQVAQTIQDEDTLNMLFLLTVADSFATGPAARSDWKVMLLVELFLKVKRILKRGVLATPDATKEIAAKKEFLIKAMPPHFQTDEILHLADQAPSRYFLKTTGENMVQHFKLALNMGDKKLSWKLEKLTTAPVTRIILCTYDKPGLFSQMVGVLALNNITVLSTNISTLKNGMAFDVYEVTNPLDPYSEKERWEKIYKEINLAVEDQFPLEDRIRKKVLATLGTEDHGKSHIRDVRIINDVSDFFTVIEVRSAAIIGLLYELAKAMYSLGLNIRFAKFGRDKEYMSGDFYVRDPLGQKIFDEKRIEDIKKSIFGITE
jgi:[protein-PII] uridylyltransferase